MSKTSDRCMVVSFYEDPRVLADLAFMLEEQGVDHKHSYSHLTHLVLEGTRNLWGKPVFDTVEEALTFLQGKGFSLAQMKGRSTSPRLLRKMQAESQEDPTVQPSIDPERLREMLEEARE